MKCNKVLWALSTVIFFLGFTHNGFAQIYPIKPIRLICPWAVGGSCSLMSRVLMKPLEKELNGTIVLEYISGGSTKMGTQEVINADPDGHTLLFATPQAMIGYYYSGTFSSKVWEQLVPIGQTGEQAYGFFEARMDAPFKTWGELVTYAKQNPGKLTCGGPGAGGMMNLIAAETAKAASINVKYIPFAGAGPSGIAVLGGHVDYRVCQPAEALPNIRAGKTRGLAISEPKRNPLLPDVPIFQELGIAFVDFPLTMGWALWAPAKLPKNILEILAKSLEKAIKDPEHIQFVQRFCYTPTFMNTQVVRENIRVFDEKLGPKLAAFYKK